MYCVVAFDVIAEEVTRFYWVSNLKRALRLKQAYQRIFGNAAEVSIETQGSGYSAQYAHACGYHN